MRSTPAPSISSFISPMARRSDLGLQVHWCSWGKRGLKFSRNSGHQTMSHGLGESYAAEEMGEKIWHMGTVQLSQCPSFSLIRSVCLPVCPPTFQSALEGKV